MNLLVLFLRSAEKMFLGPNSVGFVWGEVARALMRYMHFSAIYAILAVLATSVAPCYPVLRA